MSMSMRQAVPDEVVPIRWQRYAPVAGILFVLMLLGTIFGVFASGAEPNDPVRSIAGTLMSERSGLLARYYVQLAASGLFLVFLASLRSALYRVEGGSGSLSALAFGSALLGIGFITLTNAINAALAATIAQNSGTGAVWAVFQVGQAIFTFGALFLGVFLIASSLVIVRRPFLPHWIGWMGLIGGAAYIVGSFSVADQRGALAIPAVLGFLLFLLWTLCTSIFLLRRTEP